MNDRRTKRKYYLTELLIIVNVSEPPHLPRILALDGGGVRGLSSLLILQKLMQEVQRLKEDSNLPLPCQYFDLICGTSTGGLIAIMLGRLRMVCAKKIRILNLIGIARRCLHQKIYEALRTGFSARQPYEGNTGRSRSLSFR